MTSWLAALAAFGSSVVLVPLVRAISLRTGKIARPRPDRWHRQPTALLGGVAIFLAWVIGLAAAERASGGSLAIQWNLLWGCGLIFLVGIIDDLFHLSPPTKLIGQIIAATLAIASGVLTGFFTPRLANPDLAQLLNILLTYAWLIGMTNAINLLDNMDGLAGGIALITAGFLSYIFWSTGNLSWLTVALAVCGAAAGFLIFNFPPASIFMGDSGSQFLGFTLALLAIVHQPQASNVLAVLGVPTLLFLLPILDTTLVTITRLWRGQSPVKGGRDHTSHRLIAFGLSEKNTLLVLYLVALTVGVAAVAIEALNYYLSLVLVPLLILSLVLLTAYLGRLTVENAPDPGQAGSGLARVVMNFTVRRHLIEVSLDFFLIGIVYYLAVLVNFGLSAGSQLLQFFLATFPHALAGTYLSFFSFGVYRSVWRYVSLEDLVRYGVAALGAGSFTAILVWLAVRPQVEIWKVCLIYALFLLLGLAITRYSFRFLDHLSVSQTRLTGERVLICGAGDAGEMAVRWIEMNPGFTYLPVGFIDLDPLKNGRQIHGIEVLGQPDQLDHILESRSVAGIILTQPFTSEYPDIPLLLATARAQRCWVRILHLEFESLID